MLFFFGFRTIILEAFHLFNGSSSSITSFTVIEFSGINSALIMYDVSRACSFLVIEI